MLFSFRILNNSSETPEINAFSGYANIIFIKNLQGKLISAIDETL